METIERTLILEGHEVGITALITTVYSKPEEINILKNYLFSLSFNLLFLKNILIGG